MRKRHTTTGLWNNLLNVNIFKFFYKKFFIQTVLSLNIVNQYHLALLEKGSTIKQESLKPFERIVSADDEI